MLHRDKTVCERERHSLEKYYTLIKETILPYQSADLGLFRRLELNEFGHVNENVYCVICLWAASLAFRYIDDLSGRAYELEHSALKCMRGILYCWMHQTAQLEKFKQNPNQENCLSSVFNVCTGEPYTGPYNHLQIDAISIYILVLCQMTVSGCNVYGWSVSR